MDALAVHLRLGFFNDGLGKPQPLRDCKGIRLAGDADEQLVGRAERFHVELAACVFHARGRHGEGLELGVVRRRSDLRTLRTRLLDDGDGQCRTLNGVGARAQLIEEDQAVLVRLVQDLHDVFHMRREGRQTLLDALLVADVGQHRGKDAHGAAVVAGDMQAALRHQAEEAERL